MTEDEPAQPTAKAFMARRGSIRADDVPSTFSRHGSLRAEETVGGSFSRRGSSRLRGDLEDPTEPARSGSMRRHSSSLLDMGEMSAREAAAAQEAAEAALKEGEEEAPPEAAEEGSESEEGAEEIEQRQRQSLMDLLDESGKGYNAGGGGGVDDDDVDDASDSGAEEQACGVCMVKHKGTAIIPCGHNYCRLCSRELAVQKGNCPLCNGYIVELLRIF